MGYYTLYTIERIEGDEKLFNEFLEELAEKSGYEDLKTGEPANEMKWYDWESDCYELSKEYPTLLFMVEGDGEDVDDFWRCYFQNGKSVYYEKQWPVFNKEDMK